MGQIPCSTERISCSRSNFFTERFVNLWNTLPPDIVNFNSLCSFKRSIKLVNFSGFLKCFNHNVFYLLLWASTSAAFQPSLSSSNVLCFIAIVAIVSFEQINQSNQSIRVYVYMCDVYASMMNVYTVCTDIAQVSYCILSRLVRGLWPYVAE